MSAMRNLSQTGRELAEPERRAIDLIADGASPHDVAEQLGIEEPNVYRLVVDALDETQPPTGPTLAEVHLRHGSRPATLAELDEFDAAYGASLPADDEG